MEDGGWRMEDGAWSMEHGAWSMEDGGWRKHLTVRIDRRLKFTVDCV